MEKAPGETDPAWTSYFDAVFNYPKSYNSYSAVIELIVAGSPVDELICGIMDYYAGRYGFAQAATDSVLRAKISDRTRFEVE